jgi:hypothetical protein
LFSLLFADALTQLKISSMAEYINAVGEAQAKLAERRIDKRVIGEIGQGFEALRVLPVGPGGSRPLRAESV